MASIYLRSAHQDLSSNPMPQFRNPGYNSDHLGLSLFVLYQTKDILLINKQYNLIKYKQIDSKIVKEII